MEAGSDTTSATLLSFCLAMTKYPEVLKKCQTEVDAICADRTPTIKDVDNLPYLQAAMNEVLYPFPPIITTSYLPTKQKPRELTSPKGTPLAPCSCRWHPPRRNGRRCLWRLHHSQRHDAFRQRMGDRTR
jgi:cytochrome P450